jgi:hypothetical protein
VYLIKLVTDNISLTCSLILKFNENMEEIKPVKFTINLSMCLIKQYALCN